MAEELPRTIISVEDRILLHLLEHDELADRYIVTTSLTVLDMLSHTTELRDRLEDNTIYFRNKMTKVGFEIKPSIHPIVPILLGDAQLAQDISRDMLYEGIYVIGFSYPVVPKGEARIRVQVSAAHRRKHLNQAIQAFVKIGKKYKVIH